MAATITPGERFKYQAYDESDVIATASADVFDGPCTVYAFDIDNSAGSSTDVFLKIYDAIGATNVSRPVLAFEIRADTERRIYLGTGLYFSTGLTMRCSTAPMNHTSADGSNPAQDIGVTIIAERDS
tara:strand:- start:285 stop:665 length:381 start_codon:yes stop_codon:yes gene_type:complete